MNKNAAYVALFAAAAGVATLGVSSPAAAIEPEVCICFKDCPPPTPKVSVRSVSCGGATYSGTGFTVGGPVWVGMYDVATGTFLNSTVVTAQKPACLGFGGTIGAFMSDNSSIESTYSDVVFMAYDYTTGEYAPNSGSFSIDYCTQ